MMPSYGKYLYIILVILASGDSILSEKNSTDERVKRNNEFQTHQIQNRRANEVRGLSQTYNNVKPPTSASQGRSRPHRIKPIHVPPYAVKMEPLVQYSQRDPLYHDKEVKFNITNISEKTSKEDTFAEATNNFVDFSSYSQPNYEHAGYPPQYYKEPEPIIEIIIKESNESLPAPPSVTPVPSPKPTKEPIQVFYVKYKKNPSSYGSKEEVIYEEPIPALTPVSTDIVENPPVTESYYSATTYANPPPPSTTYRTIIRPDSEIYHGTGLKVTFSKPEETYHSHYELRSSEAQKRDSIYDQNEIQDVKVPSRTNDHHSQPKLEQRQGQNEYARFVNAKPELPSSHPALPPSHPAHQQSLQSIGGSIQPLQFEDGSFERPPPPLHHSPSHPQSKIVFPPHIPFRPQHTLSFSPPNVEFPPEIREGPPFQHPANSPFPNSKHLSDLTQSHFQPSSSILQSPKQLQYSEFLPELRPTHYQQPINVAQTKQHPQLTQAILHQPPYVQNPASSPNLPIPQDTTFSGNRHHILPPDLSRGQVPVPNELQRPPVKSNRIVQPLQDPSSITFTSQPPFRNEFAPQLSDQKLPYQPFQYEQPQFQPPNLQPSFYQERPSPDRPKLDTITQKTQPPKRPVYDDDKFRPIEHVNELKPNKYHEVKPPLNIQPNYREIISPNGQKLTQKPQKNNKNELQQLQNGQIFKSISHSENHQIINQVEPFNANNAPKQTQSYEIKYQEPLENVNFNKPPKQSFDHPSYVTTTKATVTRKEKHNSTYASSTKPTTVNKKEKDKNAGSRTLTSQLAALPAEVPDDLREQLLSSGILNNADIQILDYDKVGDIPIENLPPEALENLYGAGSAPVPSFAFPNTSKSAVEMKVVRYNSTDQKLQSSYMQEDSTEVDPVVLNDSSYNRYLPLKVKGSQFPIPDSPLLKNKRITSVVVLAPVDYDYVHREEERKGKSVPQVHGVRFVSGESLKTLVRSPTESNFRNWIEKEKQTPANKQSVILLVMNTTDNSLKSSAKEIFMYDIPTGEISKLEGELSSAFVNVAESNAESEDIDNLSETSDDSTPVSKMTSIPVYGAISEQFKNKSRRSS